MNAMRLVNPFTQPGRWYRANLHTHTTNSDGQWSPRQVTDHYRRNGYQVLALTDHNRTSDVAAFTRKGFLVVNGAEYAVRDRRGDEMYHIVALGIPQNYRPGKAVANANALIRSIRAAGGEAIFAHPFWSRVRYDQYCRLRGYAAVEVHNYGCNEIGRQDSEAHWSQLLDEGRVVAAVATDDGHGYPDQACGGWVWLKLPALTTRHVMEAIRTGCYYSSTGPRIDEFSVKDGRITLRCSPARAVYFILHGALGGVAFHAGREPVRSVQAQLPAQWEVFRAVVEDTAGRRAWTNPLVFRGGAARRQFLSAMRKSWRTPYPLCAGVPARRWRTLDLSPVANRALTGRDAWIGDGSQLTQLRPGLHRIHGVPFRIPSRGPAAVTLRSRRLRSSCGKPLPREVRVAANCRCRGVYLLHGAGFVAKHERIADYVFEYSDGSSVTWPVLGYGLPLSGRRSHERQQKLSSVQDWWPAFMQFDNTHARRLIIADRSRPYDYRVLYTLEWRNPHPEKTLRCIRLRAAPDAGPVLIVLAATVLLV